ncbi:Rhodocoxin reductase [Corynebacterium occultum]|uniref:Rhodocoxin reductase n=1 Tax=Corynebacterium occultum TaxID=2675219 RepID=A0A6B8W1U4_9CORY|nr:FAD-dependent oxidoreductase [Corynebacterium occultum]QGU06481.1 Rhodocoxin reductase [Corynebacterium occultum]
MDNILILGNGVAGLTAGDTLRRLGYTGAITIVGDEKHATYSRPALSKAALAPGPEMELNFLPEATHGGTELLGRSATTVDPEARRVTLDDGTVLDYEGLVIATGTHARRFTDSEREYTLRSLDDATALRERLSSAPKVAIIGGGPLGMEVASGAIGLGCEVTLIHPGTPMEPHIGPQLAGILTEVALENGLDIVDDFVAAVAETPGGMCVRLSSGQEITADVVVSAAGDIPNDSWLADSGLLIDGRLIADERCRVRPEIVAAGDVVWQQGARGLRRTPIWTAAIEQAKTAAAALLQGDEAAPLSYHSYFWTDQWGMNLKVSGPIPDGSEEPLVVKGSLAERSAVLHWPGQGCAASLNMRMPIPRLHKLAASVPAEV